MAFVQGEWSFYIMRMLLGVAEAGLFPGVMYFLTQWFVVKDRAKANGMFLLGVSIANIVGAPLGGLLLTMDGFGGLHGWQWMFIIEGLPACLLAYVVWKKLPDRPTQATFLTPEEATDLEARIAAEEKAGAEASGNHRLRDILKDKQILLVVGIYFTHQIAVYALSYFLPSIIGTYGKLNPLQIGLLTAIPWIFSAAGALLIPRFATDGRRSRLLVTGTMIGIVSGFALGAVGGPVLGMIGFCLAAFNFFALQPILFTYPATRLTGAALAGGIAFVNTIGLCGGFLGPYVMGMMQDTTGSKLSGLWFIVGMCIIGALLSLMLKRGTEKPAARPRGPLRPTLPTASPNARKSSWISAQRGCWSPPGPTASAWPSPPSSRRSARPSSSRTLTPTPSRRPASTASPPPSATSPTRIRSANLWPWSRRNWAAWTSSSTTPASRGPPGPSNRWTRPRGKPLSMSTSTASSSASSTPCRCCGRAGKPRS